MADKHEKLATRKTKNNNHDLTLEDVLALGGDKVRCVVEHNFIINLCLNSEDLQFLRFIFRMTLK